MALNGDKTDLRKVTEWQQAAAGTYKLEIGKPDEELRYTDLAAEKPRLEALKALGSSKFPFAKSAISTLKTADGKIMVRIPCSPDEKNLWFWPADEEHKIIQKSSGTQS